MSHAVDPAELATASEPYGTTPFLLYSSADGSARVNHVVAHVADGQPVVTVRGFGRGVQRRVDEGAPLSLLWPATDDHGFSLIADGLGSIESPSDASADDAGSILTIQISAAVLHRPAPVDDNTSC